MPGGGEYGAYGAGAALAAALDKTEPRGGTVTLRNMKPRELLAAAALIVDRMPDAELVKNDVGNLAILDPAGEQVGWIDLRYGEVELYDEQGEPS